MRTLALALLFAGTLQGIFADIVTLLESAKDWEEVENGIEKDWPLQPAPQLPPGPSLVSLQLLQLRDKVRFFLYTDTETQWCPEELYFNDYDRLVASKFNRDLPVKFFVHGFGHNFTCGFPQRLKDAYIRNGYRANIILVDWSELAMDSSLVNPIASFCQYKIAVNNLPIVGERIGDMILFLTSNGATDVNRIHLIGFSLGAHAAGYAGERVKQLCPLGILRITGLDPAGPLFHNGKTGRALTKADAQFVDIYHTDMGQSGTLRSDGHANFFINGGYPPQPTCLNEDFKKFGFFRSIPAFLRGTCSHNMAPDFYLQSIVNPAVNASSCSTNSILHALCVVLKMGTTVPFGEFCLPGTVGEYYLERQPMRLGEGEEHMYYC